MLEKAGHLKRSGKISRGIETHSSRPRASVIPILGRVAAGQPILAEESFEGSLDPIEMFGQTQELFALRIRGDSMIGAGILANDYVVVRQQERANAGEIVVALLGEEATVKFYQPRRDRVELVAANPDYPVTVVEQGTEFRILGVVKGVVRTVGR